MALKFLAWANGSSRGTSETALTWSKRARAVNRGDSFLPIEFAGPNWKLQSYSRRASSFQDEDGNGWTLSELIWRVQLGRQGALDDGSSTPRLGPFLIQKWAKCNHQGASATVVNAHEISIAVTISLSHSQ